MVWYDELTRNLHDIGASVTLMKKFGGDISYVTVPSNTHGEVVEITKNQHDEYAIDVHATEDNSVREIATLYKLSTVESFVRRFVLQEA